MRPLGRAAVAVMSAVLCAQTAAVASPERPVVVPKGDVARDTIVSISTPVLVEGAAEKGVFAAGAEVVVCGRVSGDVAVIGGRLVLKEDAVVTGSVLLVGSDQDFAPSSRVEGKLFTTSLFAEDVRGLFSDPAGYFLTVRYGAALVASRLFSALLWLVLSVFVIKLFPAHFSFACGRTKSDPGLVVGVGVVGAAGGFAILMVSLALCLLLVGIPLLLAFLVFALCAWVFGMTVLLYTVGDKVRSWLKVGARSPMVAIVLGAGVWALVGFVPVLSSLVKAVALVLALGVSLSTRFGTGRRWLSRPPAPSTLPLRNS